MAESAGASLSPADLVYIEKVRQAMRRLSSLLPEPEDIREALQVLRGVSTFDAEVPTASRRREFELVKTGVKRLSAWYVRYLAGQLNAFGASVARLGDALAARTEKLESLADDLEVRVGAVEERLARLEGAKPAPATTAPASRSSARGSSSRTRRPPQKGQSR
jgi:hypothetical protein